MAGIMPPPSAPASKLVVGLKCPTCDIEVVRTNGKTQGSFVHCSETWTFFEEKVWAENFESYDATAIETDPTIRIDDKLSRIVRYLTILGNYETKMNRMLIARRRLQEAYARISASKNKAAAVVSNLKGEIALTADKDARLKVWTMSLNHHATFNGKIPPGQNVSSLCKYARENELPLLPWLEGSSFDPAHGTPAVAATEEALPSRLFGDKTRLGG